jgi:hypothetical protein
MGKAATQCGGVVSLRADARKLLVRSEDHKLAGVNAFLTKLVVQLVERRPDSRRLRDRVAMAFRVHAPSVGPVSHRLRSPL